MAIDDEDLGPAAAALAWQEEDGEGWKDSGDIESSDTECVEEVTLMGPEDVPVVGDVIYMNGVAYIDHGQDDFCGGWGTVDKV